MSTLRSVVDDAFSSSRENIFPGLRQSVSNRSNSVLVRITRTPVGPNRRRVEEFQEEARKAIGADFLGRLNIRRSPPEDGPDAREQFTRNEGFDKIIVRPKFDAKYPVRVFAARGQHDQWRTSRVSQAHADGKSILTGKVDVEHDKVDPRACENLVHLFAVTGKPHLEPVVAEIFR